MRRLRKTPRTKTTRTSSMTPRATVGPPPATAKAKTSVAAGAKASVEVGADAVDVDDGTVGTADVDGEAGVDPGAQVDEGPVERVDLMIEEWTMRAPVAQKAKAS